MKAAGLESPIACASSLPTGNSPAAAWQELEAHAYLPTQLGCFFVAVAQTFLAEGLIEVLSGVGATGVAALLPLCRDKGYFARWRIVGAQEVFEPVDALAVSPDAMAAMAVVLARQPRALSLDRVPAGSPLIAAMRHAMNGRGWMTMRPAEPRPVITLDEGWVDPVSQFNSGRRSDFRRAARKAERRGAVTFEVITPTSAEFDALFAEAVAVELSSWKKGAGTAMGVDPHKQEFFQRFLRAACEQAICRMAFMRIDGRAVAMQMALEWADRFWLFKIGYDEEFADCSPGNLLMLHTIGHAASRGLKSYELLGNTERWISIFWTREQLPCVRLRTYPANLRGIVAFATDTVHWLSCKLARKAQ